MKRRVSAIFLALGLMASALSMGVYAEEPETAAVQETEAETEEAAEETDAAAETDTQTQEPETEQPSEEEQMKQAMTQYLTEIAAYTDEQLDQMMESDNASMAKIAANWSSVREELGNFVEINSLESGISEDGYTYTVTCDAKYDKLDENTTVSVIYEVNQKDSSVSFSWDIHYTFGKLMQRAALNTVMGIGIVFVTLVFLSWLIGRLHIIPDMIEKKNRQAAPEAPAAAPAPAAVPAVVEEEEEPVDDLELIAVITAAIEAASGQTSGDGFVVRSIKKVNKRNWQRA